MGGLDAKTPLPTEIKLHQASRVLEIAFSDGRAFRLPYELLRVYSPSAEVRGHGPGQETLQIGKRDVTIASVEAVGHYALRPTFSDGHESGIYSWDYLYDLGVRQDELWSRYLDRLAAAGASREAIVSDKTDFGYQQVPPDEKARRVRGVFDSVAGNYDLMNDLMSGGLHRAWKRFAVEIVRGARGLARARPGRRHRRSRAPVRRARRPRAAASSLPT